MILGAHGRNTLVAYRNLLLEIILWLASRGLPVAPPRKVDLSLYSTNVTCTRRSKSVAAEASRSLQFVVWLGAWPKFPDLSCCRVPIDAGEQAFSGPIKKPTPAEPWMIVAIVKGASNGPHGSASSHGRSRVLYVPEEVLGPLSPPLGRRILRSARLGA